MVMQRLYQETADWGPKRSAAVFRKWCSDKGFCHDSETKMYHGGITKTGIKTSQSAAYKQCGNAMLTFPLPTRRAESGPA